MILLFGVIPYGSEVHVDHIASLVVLLLNKFIDHLQRIAEFKLHSEGLRIGVILKRRIFFSQEKD